MRRVVEGALISLNNTFENNKGLTKEDTYINEIICKKAKIHNYKNLSAKLSSAAHSVPPPQVLEDQQPNQRIRISRRENNQLAEDRRNIPPRRSLRLQQRNNHNN